MLENYLDQIAATFLEPMRVRLTLTFGGVLDYQAVSLSEQVRRTIPNAGRRDAPKIQVSLAPAPLDSGNIYLYHKPT